MISNRPLRSAGFAAAMWLVTFMAVPAARAQSKKRPPAAAAASRPADIMYACYSTDPKQPDIYLSDLFTLPDAGSVANNFMSYEQVKIGFQIYLVNTYKDPPAEDLAECSYAIAAPPASAAAALGAKKQSVTAAAIAAKKQAVETGWRYTQTSGASAAATTGGPASGRHVAQQGAAPRSANQTSGPLFQWHMEKKTDALTNEVSTQPASMKIIAGANGTPQGLVSVRAYCSSNGVSVFFLADAGDKDPKPSFPWYDDPSRGEDAQITDVRLLVDDRPVHVAQGFPEIDGHQSYTNTLGLLFYEPHTAQRAVRDQENRMTTGVAALDGMLGGIVKQSAQSNVQTWQSSAAGPLSDLISARSIRIELPVTTFDPKPVLDLNPQDPVLHKFVNDCNARFTR